MNIRIYLTKEVVGWIIGKKGWRIKQIKYDNNVEINYNKTKNYFEIIGNEEKIHKTRIILQELEKEYYKKIYLDSNNQTKNYIKNLLKEINFNLNEFKNK